MRISKNVLFLLILFSCNSLTVQTENSTKEEGIMEESDTTKAITPTSLQVLNDGRQAIDSSSNTFQAKKKYAYTPNLDLTIWEKSNWDLRIDTIPESAFDSSRLIKKKHPPRHKKYNSDSLLRQLALQYPEGIILSDSCCTLKTTEGEIKMCMESSSDIDRGSSGYSFSGMKKQFLMFSGWGHEYWWYALYNPEDRYSIGLANSPIFINDQVVYAFGNYYGEGQFEVHDILNNKSYGFDTFNWSLLNLYYDNNAFYLQFRCERGDRRMKYLRISI